MDEAVNAAKKLLKSLKSASAVLDTIRDSTLFGIAGGLLGLLAVAALRLEYWPWLPLSAAAGILIGHLAYRSSRGLSSEAKADADRAMFEEARRRRKILTSDERKDRRAEFDARVEILEDLRKRNLITTADFDAEMKAAMNYAIEYKSSDTPTRIEYNRPPPV